MANRDQQISQIAVNIKKQKHLNFKKLFGGNKTEIFKDIQMMQVNKKLKIIFFYKYEKSKK